MASIQTTPDKRLIPFSNGLELEFHPLSYRAHIELNEWVRAQCIKAARKADEPLEEAILASASVLWMDPVGRRILQSVEGTVELLRASIRKEVGSDLIDQVLADPQFQLDIWTSFLTVNGYKVSSSSSSSNGESVDPTKLSAQHASS